MRCLLLALFVAVCAAELGDEHIFLFKDFKETYGRKYDDEKHETHALECFRKNLKIIDELNAEDPSAFYGINKFADLCPQDFKIYHNAKFNLKKTMNFAATIPDAERLAAATVDWRTKGAVTHVKNQGQCGSCWSFSSTGNMEGQHFLKAGKLVSLSEEELVQCSHNGNKGCQGGEMTSAFEWVVKNGGIDTEANYPYTSGMGRNGQCNNAKLKDHAASFNGSINVKHDETQMAAWVMKNGPLSIGVDAGIGWQLYFGGIKSTCACHSMDHGVLIVGYGTSARGEKYWIVKNSWGSTWGERGYIQLKRGVNCNCIKEDPCSSVA